MKNSRLVLTAIIILAGIKVLAQNNQESSMIVTPKITHELIENIKMAMMDNYIFPDTAAKMIAYLEKEFKKGSYSGIKDPAQLAGKLDADLQTSHRDGHLRIMYDPRLTQQLLDTTDMEKKRRLNDSMSLADMRHNNFYFSKAEILDGNIGYISFNQFVGFVNEAKPTVEAALRFVANTNALIIDLRNNGGGSPQMVNLVESYFFPGKTHMNDIVDRSGKTDVFWTDPSLTEGLTLNMPVYILTSGLTFSGAEDFTYGMQSVKRAIVVGDTTGGGAHPTGIYNLDMGFIGYIPHLRSLNPYTHTDWEGIGIIPDIALSADDAVIAAQRDYFTKQIASAKTDREKKQLQWALNSLLAKMDKQNIDSAQLSICTGTFAGGLRFYIKDNSLYCMNGERGNTVTKLQHISNNMFVLDENVQVEFVTDKSAQVSGIAMHWSDGGESFKGKENK